MILSILIFSLSGKSEDNIGKKKIANKNRAKGIQISAENKRN